MKIYNKKESLILFIGDVVTFIVSLWLALLLRNLEIPTKGAFLLHLWPFSFVFVAWIVSYFVAGLYGKHTLLFKSRLPTLILKTQIINSVIAVAFFYFIPLLVITPKTLLFIYITVSFGLILFWRVRFVSYLGFRRKQKAFLIGEGKELHELYEEVNHNQRYALSFVGFLDVSKGGFDIEDDLVRPVYEQGISVIVVDVKNSNIEPLLPHLYNLLFANVQFVDMYKVYEDIFDRVPLSLLRYSWFLQNISVSSHAVYDFMKRIMDIAIALPVGLVSFIFYPFVWIAIKLDDGGPVFILQERVGQDNKIIKILKFRSMKTSDTGVWVKENDNRITRVGRILRASRIDELPQLFSVIKGDMSLVGPRPDIYDLGMKLSKEIPYYNVRNIIKPGLSGWAQIKQENPPQSIEETKLRLSYDFYYIKHRSFLIDFKIAIQTISTLL